MGFTAATGQVFAPNGTPMCSVTDVQVIDGIGRNGSHCHFMAPYDCAIQLGESFAPWTLVAAGRTIRFQYVSANGNLVVTRVDGVVV